MKRRMKVRITAFALAIFTTLMIWGVSETVIANNYSTLVKLSRQRSLTQICEYLDNIETDLAKTQYATGGAMLSTLSTNLLRESSGAKTSLSALEAGEVGLYNIYKFLSQVGEYTASLSRKAAAGEEITAEDRKILSDLLQYASSLSIQFDQMSELNNSDYFTFEELNNTLLETNKNSEELVSYMNAVSDAEQTMADYPTLIYDGPFSDSVLNAHSVMLENEKDVSLEKARQTAAEILGVDKKLLHEDGMSEGEIITYDFYCETVYVSVSKKGGYPVYILSDAVVGETKISEEEAVDKAKEFLEKIGFTDMKESYYYTTDGICTVNFAYTTGEFICYPDLIKVSISLYDGKVTSMDAIDYLMNHTERQLPSAVVSKEDAMKVISSNLKVEKVDYAVIPTDSGEEKFAYEFLCEAENGQDILVYVDMQTGEETDILILLYSDNGTLTK